ncbi:MAG: SOS response-associated peptidase [Burkholderiales bacterium]|jgi:putative SOS response-associated peptidase YedK
MCGRYTLSSTPARINARFEVTIDPDWKPNYNIAPGTNVLIVHADADSDERVSAPAYWGFTPSWIKPGASAPRPINARSEGVAGKPMFRAAFARRRCILPADGFYEWKALERGKQPWLIRMRDGGLFGFAGIYEPGNEMTQGRPSCAILTTQANALMRPIHNRMPVILEPDDYARWLDPGERDTPALEELLRPSITDELVAFAVSTRVNNAKNNDESLIRPAGES